MIDRFDIRAWRWLCRKVYTFFSGKIYVIHNRIAKIKSKYLRRAIFIVYLLASPALFVVNFFCVAAVLAFREAWEDVFDVWAFRDAWLGRDEQGRARAWAGLTGESVFDEQGRVLP